MPKISFFRDANAAMIPAEFGGAGRMRHTDGADGPQLLEVELEPEQVVEVHAHKEPEIILLLAGEMHFGAQVVRAGESVSISGLTLYGFHAGPQGARYVNFRPRSDQTFFSPEELAEYRTLSGDARVAMERRITEAFLARINMSDAAGGAVPVD